MVHTRVNKWSTFWIKLFEGTCGPNMVQKPVFALPGCQRTSVNTLLCDTLGLADLFSLCNWLRGVGLWGLRLAGKGPLLFSPSLSLFVGLLCQILHFCSFVGGSVMLCNVMLCDVMFNMCMCVRMRACMCVRAGEMLASVRARVRGGVRVHHCNWISSHSPMTLLLLHDMLWYRDGVSETSPIFPLCCLWLFVILCHESTKRTLSQPSTPNLEAELTPQIWEGGWSENTC